MILVPHFTPCAWATLEDLGVTQADYRDYLDEVEEVSSEPDCTRLELDRTEILRMLEWMHRTGTVLDASGVAAYCVYVAHMLWNPIGRA